MPPSRFKTVAICLGEPAKPSMTKTAVRVVVMVATLAGYSRRTRMRRSERRDVEFAPVQSSREQPVRSERPGCGERLPGGGALPGRSKAGVIIRNVELRHRKTASLAGDINHSTRPARHHQLGAESSVTTHGRFFLRPFISMFSLRPWYPFGLSWAPRQPA